MRPIRTASLIVTAMAAVAWGLVVAAPPSIAQVDGRDARAVSLESDVGAFSIAYSAKAQSVYVAGNVPVGDNDVDIFLRRYSLTGQLLWQRMIATPMREYARGVAVDAQGNPVITGWRDNDRDDDVLLARFNSRGKKLWEKSYDDVFNDDDRGNAVAIDAAGDIWVAGRVTAATEYSAKIWWSRWSPKGTMRAEWTAQGSIIGWSEAFGIAIANKTIYLAGSVFETTPDGYVGVYSDAWLGAFSPEGFTRWERSWGTPGRDDVARSVTASADRQVYVTGALASPQTSEDIFLRRLTNKGKKVWNHVLLRPGSDMGNGVTVTADGRSITVVGTLGLGTFDSDAVVLSRSSQNTHRFVTVLPSPGMAPEVSTPDGGLAITVGGRGHLYLSGRQAPTVVTMDSAWPAAYGMSQWDSHLEWTSIFDPVP